MLNGADMLPSWGDHVWDTSALLSDDSLVGLSLHALVGYSAQPSGIQLAAYLATLLTLVIASRAISRVGKRTLVAAAVGTLLLVGAPGARADKLPVPVVSSQLAPSRIAVPAPQKFKLLVRNSDSTDEFARLGMEIPF